MKCPYCGNVTEPEAKYCSVCGGPANQIIVPTVSAPKETSKKDGRSRLVSVIVYIVIIVMVLSIPAYLTIRTVVDVTTTAVDLSVTETTYVADPFHAPDDGNRFVHLTAIITNNGGGTITMTPSQFHIQTKDSTTYHDFTTKYGNTVPERLTGGSTATLSMTFEVPADKTPAILSYQRLMTSDVIESAIGAVGPAIVKVTIDDDVRVSDDVGSSEDGFKRVQVGFNMTNGYNESFVLNTSEFKLGTMSDAVYNCSSMSSDGNLEALDGGTTGSISVVFEMIPTADPPARLIFEIGGLHLSVDLAVP